MAVFVAQLHKKSVKSFTKDDLESGVVAKSFILFAPRALCGERLQHSGTFIFFPRLIMQLPSL